jgi:hypothetical protein
VAVLYALAYVFGREQLTVRATAPQPEGGVPHLQDEHPIAATT